RIVGVEACCVTTGGYIKLSVCNKRYYGHRLAWLYVFGQWPNDELDHINLVTSDNRIANLREATKAQNNSNCSVRSHSKSGKKGVDFVQSTGKWRAKISKNRRRIHLGTFNSPEEAHAAYCAAARIHFGEFARAE